MKPVLWLALVTSAFAQECTYTLAHSRPGALAVFRNGRLLQPSDYTRAGTLGRTITLNGWTDKDQITYMYPFAATTPVPGTSPPSTILLWIPTIEFHTCTGTLNPPAGNIAITRKVCRGLPNCEGMEEFSVILPDGSKRFYFAVASETRPLNITDCPTISPGMGCFEEIPINDPAMVKYHAAYIVVLPN